MEEKKQKKSFKSKKRLIELVIILIIIIAVFSMFGKKKSSDGLGNLANMGLAANGDGAVFYNKYEDGIVKVKGFEEFQITNETAYGINVVGDDVYFLSVGDTSNIAIKKVKTNGNELTTIKKVKTSISKIYVDNNHIYYATNESQDGIARIKLDGSEEKIIIYSDISDFEVINGKIYFADKMGNIYKANINGENKKKIELDYSINNFQVKDNYIYYFNKDNKNLCKIKDDGEEPSVVSEYVNSEVFNITSKRIYFFDKEAKKIASINLKGGDYKEIVSISTNNTKINVVDDIIYYLDASNNESKIYQMYRIKTNGKNTKNIEY